MENVLEQKYKRNIDLYKKYKIFSYDFLFYQGIYMLYFTMTKGFSISQVILIGAFFEFFMFFWQIPANFIVEKIGLKRCIILGNILVLIEGFMYIIAKDYTWIIFGDFFGALGFTLKSVSEGALLYLSLKNTGEVKKFAKVEGKSNARFYYYDAFSSLISGFLFLFNQYIPIILSFIHLIISLVLSLFFHDIKETKDIEKIENINTKGLLKNWKKILKSKRTTSLLLFAFFFTGIIAVCGKLYRAMLQDLGVMPQYITMIICIVTVYTGIGTRSMYKIERQAGNKTLTLFSTIYPMAFLCVGFIGISSIQNIYTISILIILLLIMGVIAGAYRVAMKKYVLSFTNEKIRTKVLSMYYIFENLGNTTLLFLTGIILNFHTASVSGIIVASVALIVMMLILYYIKDKLGLKPEDYSKEEIYEG